MTKGSVPNGAGPFSVMFHTIHCGGGAYPPLRMQLCVINGNGGVLHVAQIGDGGLYESDRGV